MKRKKVQVFDIINNIILLLVAVISFPVCFFCGM